MKMSPGLMFSRPMLSYIQGTIFTSWPRWVQTALPKATTRPSASMQAVE